MLSIIDAISNHQLNASVVAVVSNRPDAKGLIHAQQHGIPTYIIDHQDFASRGEFEQQLTLCIDQLNPDLVILAGFMRILGADFVLHYRQRLINIHPSLLPKYKGLNTHQRAIDNGDLYHGASVHFVTAELDDGPIILQAKVAVLEDDTAETLAQRVLIEEHLLYPKAIQKLIDSAP